MIKSLTEWNKNIEDLRQDLLAWSMNIKKPGASWWERNKFNLMFLILLSLLMVWSYYMEWVWIYRILGILIFIQVLQFLIRLGRKLWILVKTYRMAKKLLKPK